MSAVQLCMPLLLTVLYMPQLYMPLLTALLAAACLQPVQRWQCMAHSTPR